MEPLKVRVMQSPEDQTRKPESFEGMVFLYDKMRHVTEVIMRVAPYKVNVLITGENGTGKELVAKAIHKRSRLFSKPLITVDCPCLEKGQMESTLFGHKKGSFTGSVSDRKGAFELADNATIFLDEIAEI